MRKIAEPCGTPKLELEGEASPGKKQDILVETIKLPDVSSSLFAVRLFLEIVLGSVRATLCRTHRNQFGVSFRGWG